MEKNIVQHFKNSWRNQHFLKMLEEEKKVDKNVVQHF
jgi:hypothetical protein